MMCLIAKELLSFVCVCLNFHLSGLTWKILKMSSKMAHCFLQSSLNFWKVECSNIDFLVQNVKLQYGVNCKTMLPVKFWQQMLFWAFICSPGYWRWMNADLFKCWVVYCMVILEVTVATGSLPALNWSQSSFHDYLLILCVWWEWQTFHISLGCGLLNDVKTVIRKA